MENKLERKYGLFTAICMVVGIVIGSGVFFKAQAILQKTGGNRGRIQHQAGKQARNGQRMKEIRLTGLAHLAFMRPLGKVIRLFNHGHIRFRMIFDHNLNELFQASALLLCQAGVPPFIPSYP